MDQAVKDVQLARSARLSEDGVALMGMERFHILIATATSQTFLNKETVEEVTAIVAIHLGIHIRNNPTSLTDWKVQVTDRDAADYVPVRYGR